jgi:hypothetical protein
VPARTHRLDQLVVEGLGTVAALQPRGLGDLDVPPGRLPVNPSMRGDRA